MSIQAKDFDGAQLSDILRELLDKRPQEVEHVLGDLKRRYGLNLTVMVDEGQEKSLYRLVSEGRVKQFNFVLAAGGAGAFSSALIFNQATNPGRIYVWRIRVSIPSGNAHVAVNKIAADPALGAMSGTLLNSTPNPASPVASDPIIQGTVIVAEKDNAALAAPAGTEVDRVVVLANTMQDVGPPWPLSPWVLSPGEGLHAYVTAANQALEGAFLVSVHDNDRLNQ